MTQSHLRQFSARGKHWPCCTKPRWDSEGNDALLELPVLQRDEPALEELKMGCEGWSRRWRASLRQRALVAWLSRDTVALSKPTGRKGVYAAMEKSYWREQIGTDRPSITWKPRAVTGRKFWSSLCTAGGGGANLPSFITTPLWGLFDRAAPCSHGRTEPLSTARDADSRGANGN